MLALLCARRGERGERVDEGRKKERKQLIYEVYIYKYIFFLFTAQLSHLSSPSLLLLMPPRRLPLTNQ
jgi:hypothetical protein